MRSFTILLAAAALIWGPIRGDAQEYAPLSPDQYQAAQLYGGVQQAAAEQYAANQFAAAQEQAVWAGYGEPMLTAPDYGAFPAEDSCCPDGACGCCAHCCRQHDIWGSAEFLMWWAKGTITPALVTTSPQGTPQPQAGVRPGATVLFGQEYLGKDLQTGARLTMGIWLDPEHNVSAVGRFYGTGGDTSTYSASSLGDPILARPFYNVLLDQQDALLIAFDSGGTDIVDGSIAARLDNNNFLGAEGYLQIMMERDHRRRIDLIAGYQFTRIDDALTINSTQILRQLGNLQIDLSDRFACQNKFHGGLIGLKGQLANGCWSLEGLAKVGLGVSQQNVSIQGSVLVNGVPQPSGGLLALPTNIGTYQRQKFTAIPEFTTNLRYHFSPNLSCHLGYSLMLWSGIVNSGNQIDFGVNPSQLITGVLVGEARPEFNFNDTSYWMQGINFGVNWDY